MTLRNRIGNWLWLIGSMIALGVILFCQWATARLDKWLPLAIFLVTTFVFITFWPATLFTTAIVLMLAFMVAGYGVGWSVNEAKHMEAA